MESRFNANLHRPISPITPPRTFQADLTVNQPGDRYEREADRVAEQSIQMPAASSLSRRAASQSGFDFSGVQIRADAKAAESARAVNALAFMVGKTIVFGAGQYQPHTLAGKKLLAHELAHVVQQNHTLHPTLIQRQQKSQGETEKSLREASERDCKDVRVLKILSREPESLPERVKRLERRISVIPRFFKAKGQFDKEISKNCDKIFGSSHLSNDRCFQLCATNLRTRHDRVHPLCTKVLAIAKTYEDLWVKVMFPKGHVLPPPAEGAPRPVPVLGSESEELARAKCQLSRARLDLFVSQQRRTGP